MSRFKAAEPICTRKEGPVALVIRSRKRDLGGLSVRRVLPAPECRMVGPFIFLDEMGPVEYPAGDGIDVRPHPHIGLSTVTWLFDGEILHRDSLGTQQVIRPGALNLMTAGRGIVHSERRVPGENGRAHRLHGLQIWMALPRDRQEAEPAFEHYPAERFPVSGDQHCRNTVVIGRLGHSESPVRVPAETLYVVQELVEGATVSVPDLVAQRALYMVEGCIELDGGFLRPGEMAVLNPGRVHVIARAPSRMVLLGGEPFSRRHIWWNFVHTDRDRIEQAKDDWREGRFASVPGDEEEFIPLPSN